MHISYLLRNTLPKSPKFLRSWKNEAFPNETDTQANLWRLVNLIMLLISEQRDRGTKSDERKNPHK